MTIRKGLRTRGFKYGTDQKYCISFESGWEEVSFAKNAYEAEKKVQHLQSDYGSIVKSVNLKQGL